MFVKKILRFLECFCSNHQQHGDRQATFFWPQNIELIFMPSKGTYKVFKLRLNMSKLQQNLRISVVSRTFQSESLKLITTDKQDFTLRTLTLISEGGQRFLRDVRASPPEKALFDTSCHFVV